MKALDVGCGSGQFLDALQSAGWAAQGTEVNRQALEAVRKKGHRVHEGPLRVQRFATAAFDAVTYVGTFEHVAEPRQELCEARRILRRGGGLIVNVTNAGSAEARLFGPTWFGYEAPRHCFNYTLDSITRLLTVAGFKVVGVDRQASTLITGYSIAAALRAEAWYPQVSPVLNRALRVYRATLGRWTAGNLLEVTGCPANDDDCRTALIQI